MTAAELHALDTYTQCTLGRPVSRHQCAVCGAESNVNYRGLCERCQRKSKPTQENVVLFKPLRRS